MFPPRTKAQKQSSLLSKEKTQVLRLGFFLYLGAGSMPPLELFDCIVKEYDLLVLWNAEVTKLLDQEMAEGVLDVTY